MADSPVPQAGGEGGGKDALSIDGLIRYGLAAKDRAIAAYDEMLWKIRTGYAAVLYGLFTLALSVGEKIKWELPLGTALAVALTLITGFTLCAIVLDFFFLRSKFRVIQAKEELVDLALLLASGKRLDAWQGRRLNVLLHNAGEGKARVDWKARPWRPIVLLYLGTWGPLCVAVLWLFLAIRVSNAAHDLSIAV